ncbi:MAG: YajQ family cyclic di-GMP-binding protein, partial [Acinetobacter sp.]|nr:YajQ family cyclic di-GMP-binding protein [Acinetobacter sp.]
VEFNEKNKEIKLSAESDFQVDQVRAMLENHLLKRKVDAQVLDPQKMEASGKLVHQIIKLKDGLDSDTAKKIVKLLKENGHKVQASIQGDKVRVTDKKRDTLQTAMAFLREQQLGLPLQFNNFKD